MKTKAQLQAVNAEVIAALKAITMTTPWGQLCFRTHNGIPMGMSSKQARIVAAALTKAEK